MMRMAAASFTAVLVFPLLLSGQGAPDFSGTWTMDVARSQTPHQGEPVKLVSFVITQSPSQVRIETTRGVVIERKAGITFDRDVIVVIEANQFSKLHVSGK